MADHLVLLVEEPSMEAFLHLLIPRLLPDGCTFEVHAFQGKRARQTAGAAARLSALVAPPDGGWWCSSIQDDDDCRELMAELEQAAAGAGLLSRTTAGARPWQVVNRVVRSQEATKRVKGAGSARTEGARGRPESMEAVLASGGLIPRLLPVPADDTFEVHASPGQAGWFSARPRQTAWARLRGYRRWLPRRMAVGGAPTGARRRLGQDDECVGACKVPGAGQGGA